MMRLDGDMENLLQARKLCIEIEKIAPAYGYHVALTGGTLYKEGERKDIDLILYGIRQETQNRDDLEEELSNELGLGFKFVKRQGWLSKAVYEGKNIDLLYPDYKPDIFEKALKWIPFNKREYGGIGW